MSLLLSFIEMTVGVSFNGINRNSDCKQYYNNIAIQLNPLTKIIYNRLVLKKNRC